jgi:hypothetical protein
LAGPDFHLSERIPHSASIASLQPDNAAKYAEAPNCPVPPAKRDDQSGQGCAVAPYGKS